MSKTTNRSRPPHHLDASSPDSGTHREIEQAREASYVAFLHRHPWATDAYEIGFTSQATIERQRDRATKEYEMLS